MFGYVTGVCLMGWREARLKEVKAETSKLLHKGNDKGG